MSDKPSVPVSSMPSEVNRKDDLHTDGIEKFTAPGVGSNWLDWSFQMESSINASIYAHVMTSTPKVPPPQYEADKAKLCGVFACYVSSPNLVILRKHRSNPIGMWNSLKAAHEVNSAGSRMFWLEKLVSFKLESDEVVSELQRIESIVEHLGLLVTPSRPLTVDKILCMVVATCLPLVFKPVIKPLLQLPVITLVKILTAVRKEVTRNTILESSRSGAGSFHSASRASSSVDMSSRSESQVASQSSASQADRSQQSRNQSQLVSCTHCGRKGHSIKTCRTKLADDLEAMKIEVWALRSAKTAKSSHKEKENRASEAESNDSSSIDIPSSSEEHSVSASVERSTGSSTLGSIMWGLVSMCSKHMAPPSVILDNVFSTGSRVHLEDNTIISALGIGVTTLPLEVAGNHEVLQVPKLHEPLLSVARLADKGLRLEFTNTGCFICHALTGKSVHHGVRRGNIYYLKDDLAMWVLPA